MSEIVDRREIKDDYIPSEEMTVDPMTKGLSLETFTRHVENMGQGALLNWVSDMPKITIQS